MSDDNDTSLEMPRYRCHKEVWALKIARVVDQNDLGSVDDGARILEPADIGYGSIRVNRDWMLKHDPQPGGYYVLYGDGYTSYSPGPQFESGYTRIE